jgi:ABC-type transporter Mla subunit MlaD
VPVEIDEVIAMFKRPLRRDVKRLLDASGTTLDRMSPSLRRGLEVAPAVIGEASGVLRDLSLNQATLRSLVRSTGSVVDAVDRSSPRMRELLDGAAETLGAVADESERLQLALTRMPGALQEVRNTLPEADQTLTAAADVTTLLAPGVARLRRISAPLNRLLASLVAVGQDASGTLRTTRRGAPEITRLLGRLTTVAPELEAIGRSGSKQLDCIRPYTPEILMLATTWGDFTSPTDGKDRYIRANIQNYFPAPYNNVPMTPAELLRAYPGLEYGFPRPPGQVAGQPWFQPQCGAGPEALDPANDSEAKTYRDNLRPPWMVSR